uniref:Uncharacterized protein n=1 Tax=Arundo donax TaxID=35708 RepID=A0A0A8YVN6_ARUDO
MNYNSYGQLNLANFHPPSLCCQ